LDLTGEPGYQLKASESKVCIQRHGKEEREGFKALHQEHVEEEVYDRSHGHAFSRPDRKLRYIDIVQNGKLFLGDLKITAWNVTPRTIGILSSFLPNFYELDLHKPSH